MGEGREKATCFFGLPIDSAISLLVCQGEYESEGGIGWEDSDCGSLYFNGFGQTACSDDGDLALTSGG